MTTKTHNYGNLFFDYVDADAYRSASQLLPVLRQFIEISSVLDVGCGRGAWLAVWRSLGVSDCLGVDGKYVDTSRLNIPRDAFLARDISTDLVLSRKFDLVECLEVAEHIPETRADTLVKNLVLHGDVILYSAAVPGQGGEFHVNEQPYEYWRDKFAQHGYRAFDFLRPAIRECRLVGPWYRYNSLVFANQAGVARLSLDAVRKEIPRDSPIEDFSSFGWRVRTRILRMFPQTLVHCMAHVRHLVSKPHAG